jgi:hypothetical protein
MSDAISPREPSTAPSGPDDSLMDLPAEVWGEDLAAQAGSDTSWLWYGYLARGNITLLTSQWKTGKTTLLALLLARRERGGELAGRAVAPGRTVVVSEEPPLLWDQRRRKLGFGASAGFQCRPFPGKPMRHQWLALTDRLAELWAKRGVDLAVIDNLATFLPGRTESDANVMLEALAPLKRLAGFGMAVLLLHHPRKGPTIAGQASRGSGALTGHVDIVIEMQSFAQAAADDRRRMLRGFSRHGETPLRLAIELNPDGTDYVCLDPAADSDFVAGWQDIRHILGEAHLKLTRREILARWPAEDVPGKSTVWRWLDEAVVRQLVSREGQGQKSAPYRYWLAGQEEKWKRDPMHGIEEMLFQDRLNQAELERRYGDGMDAG